MSPRARVNWLRLSLLVGAVIVVLAGVGVIGYVFLLSGSGPLASNGPAAQPTEAPVTISEIPLTVKVAKVAGKLPANERTQAEQQIDEVLTRYVSNAYLGLYPREDFSGAYNLMDPNLVKFAQKDAAVIAGEQWATRNVSVDSGTLTAKISLLAVNKKPVGATAYVTWTFLVTPLPPDLISSASTSSAEPSPSATTTSPAGASGTEAASTTVTVKGRVLLALGTAGWQIFGYDVAAPDATPISATGSTTTGSTATGGSGQ